MCQRSHWTLAFCSLLKGQLWGFSLSGCFVANFAVQKQPQPLAEGFQGSSGNSFLVSCDFLILIFFFCCIWTQLWKWSKQLQHRPTACAVWCSVNNQLWSFCGYFSIPGSTQEKQDQFGIFSAPCWISCLLLLRGFTRGLWCPWSMGINGGSIFMLVFVLNPRELGAIHAQWWQDFSVTLVALPALVSSCHGLYIPHLCWWFSCPWMGAWEVLPCLQSFVLGRKANPQELLLLSHPDVGCSHQTSVLLCCHCHPGGVLVHGHGLCLCSLCADPAQPAHRGHLSVGATAWTRLICSVFATQLRCLLGCEG